MNYLERRGFLKRYPWSAAPIQVGLCRRFIFTFLRAFFIFLRKNLEQFFNY